jgi:hypothetical protein
MVLLVVALGEVALSVLAAVLVRPGRQHLRHGDGGEAVGQGLAVAATAGQADRRRPAGGHLPGDVDLGGVGVAVGQVVHGRAHRGHRPADDHRAGGQLQRG